MSAPRTVVFATAPAAVAVAGVLAVASADPARGPAPATPIKHLVVIYDENESFDHYFGTYPNATNPPGQPRFEARAGTRRSTSLTANLLTENPNRANPRRLDRSEAVTCDQRHNYGDEQRAANNGAMNKFVEFTAGGSCSEPGIVMAYYDGNTVTALWNYAQHYAHQRQLVRVRLRAVHAWRDRAHQRADPRPDQPAPRRDRTGTMIGDPQPRARRLLRPRAIVPARPARTSATCSTPPA